MCPAADEARALLESAARDYADGNLQAAESRCRAIAATEPGVAAQRSQLLGLILASQGRMADAAAAYGEALRFAPENAGVRFGLGYGLHALGRHEEALPHLQRAAALAPEYAEAHLTLGRVMLALGRDGEALACCERAAALDAESAAARVALGVALVRARRAEEAEACFRRALELDPNAADATLNLGLVLIDRGLYAEAEERLEQAVAARPDLRAALIHLGNLQLKGGAADRAAESLERALALDPDDASVRCMLGNARLAAKQLPEAAAEFQRALASQPRFAGAHLGLGRVRLAQNDLDGAAAALRQAVALEGGLTVARSHLGTVLRLQGRPDEAQAELRQAIAEQPGMAHAHLNLGYVLIEQMRLDEAEASFRHALSAAPGSAAAHYGLAVIMLRRGDYARGWQEYEWRWQLDGEERLPDYGPPLWRGEDPAGRAILLYGEQGLGDTLQFVRYAPLLAARGARVILSCARPLGRLLASVEGVTRVIGGENERAVFDFHCPLMSLPLCFGTTLETVPARVPYLHADPERVAWWRAKLGERPPGRLAVGLVWAGMSRPGQPDAHSVDLRRSLSLSQLAPLGEVAGVDFYSLQKGPPGAQAASPPGTMTLTDHTAELGDFADTAALIANLDLVIAVDTSVAHLAGGMGKPVWILSRFDGCWRWLLDRDDSPWYPTARIFRQRRAGEWESVVERLATELREVAVPGGIPPGVPR